MGTASTKEQKSVVIIGGGVAASKLCALLDSKVNLTVIEKRDHYLHSVASLRAIAIPTNFEGSAASLHEDRCVIPYSKMLKRGKVVTGEAVNIAPGVGGEGFVVMLSDGKKFCADAIILATGAGQNSMGRPGDNAKTGAEMKRSLGDLREKIDKASRVVIVGGGPIGVELAGELKHFRPTLGVTLVHSGESLLSHPSYRAPEKAKAKLRALVEGSGVQLLLGDSLDQAIFYQGQNCVVVQEEAFTYRTKQGVSLELKRNDVLVKATGVSGPSGQLLDSDIFERGVQIDEKGYFVIDEHFQLKDRPGLFALGDCTSFQNEQKTIYIGIMNRMGLVKKNVLNFLAKKPSSKWLVAKPPAATGTLLIPYGPKKGVGFMGKTVLGGTAVSMFKGKDLFTTPTWGDVFKGKPPAVPPKVYS